MPKTASNTTTFIGIDPGFGGGIAWIRSGVAQAISMPSTEKDIWEHIHSLTDLYTNKLSYVYGIIEKVHSMPGQGVASTFKFGTSYGMLRMALIAAGITFDEVQPRKWQQALGIPSKGKTESNTQWKNRLKAKAQQLFPKLKVTLKTADALLISEYCRRINQ